MKDYGNAYAEAYVILNYLDEDELNKIPEDVFSVIEENRNKDYYYEMNEDLNLQEQPMLPETKALLFNLFRDYLCTPVQKEKIIEWQRKERLKNEENKKQNYSNTNIFETRSNQVVKEKVQHIDNLPIPVKKEGIFKKLMNLVKKLLKR